MGARGRSHRRGWEGLTAVIFLFGIAALFLLKLPFWPGILVVVGVGSFASEAGRGRYFQALNAAIWLFGLAFLFSVPRLWWPGMLVIIGLSVLIDMARRSLRRP